MSNVPQDVIERLFEADKFGQFSDDFDQPLAKSIRHDIKTLLAQLRAQRSNAEPVAIVTVGSQDHGPFSYRETAYGLDHLPDGESKLYTAPPDYAAGMMRAAEICDDCHVSWDVHRVNDDTLWNNACTTVKSAILDAIPADSQAALREVCMKVAEAVTNDSDYFEEELIEIVNSVLEGKS